MRRVPGFLLTLLLCAVWGCDDSSVGDNRADVVDASVAPDAGPPWGQWSTIYPGGDTICSRGDPYRFYFREGDPEKLMIYFQGGGACWNDLTCSVADAIFSDKVNEPEDLNEWVGERSHGIFDTSENGLFADWSVLFIPYCTGDIHWGNATVEYANGLTIHHRGYVNTMAALEHAYSKVLNPTSVFVTGCSAGAYGSILNSARVAEQYPDAIVSVLADSGAGIITDSFLVDSFPNWDSLAHMPEFFDLMDRPLADLSIEDLYITVGEAFGQHRFAQYTTAFDQDQTFYWEAMGGDYREFAPRLRQTLDNMSAALSNFHVYYAPGSMHCITIYPFFDTREVNGVKFKDWLSQLVQGQAPPESVQCEGEDCLNDPVCDACAENDEGPGCGFCRDWPDRYLPDASPPQE